MKFTLIIVGTLLGTVCSAAEIYFDEIVGSSFWEGSDVPVQNRLTDQYLDRGVAVSSSGGFAAVVDLDSAFVPHAPTPRNGIAGTDSQGRVSYRPTDGIEFRFHKDGHPAEISDMSLHQDLAYGGGVVTISAYSYENDLIGEWNFEDLGLEMNVQLAGMHRVVVRSPGGVAFDNLKFDEPVAIVRKAIPDSVFVNLGRRDRGNTLSLHVKDGDVLRVCRFLVPNFIVDPVEVEVEGQLGLLHVEFLQAKLFGRMATPGAFACNVFFQNFQHNRWDSLSRFDLTRVFVEVTVQSGSQANEYISSNGRVALRYSIGQTGPSAIPGWCHEQDQVVWEYR